MTMLCKSVPKNEEHSERVGLPPQGTLLLKDCIPVNKADHNDSNFVKYIIIDSFYSIELKIGTLDTILAYRFDCTTPRGLVPRLYSNYKDVLCLESGSGRDYREFIIAYLNKSKIVLKRYEIALTENLKRDMIVYRNYNQSAVIVIENFRTNKRRIFKLPAKYESKYIVNATIHRFLIELKFDDGDELSINIK